MISMFQAVLHILFMFGLSCIDICIILLCVYHDRQHMCGMRLPGISINSIFQDLARAWHGMCNTLLLACCLVAPVSMCKFLRQPTDFIKKQHGSARPTGSWAVQWATVGKTTAGYWTANNTTIEGPWDMSCAIVLFMLCRKRLLSSITAKAKPRKPRQRRHGTSEAFLSFCLKGPCGISFKSNEPHFRGVDG